MESDLFGPEISEEPQAEQVVSVGNKHDVWAWQLVNRWVFLKHQRAAALTELRALIADVKVAARNDTPS